MAARGEVIGNELKGRFEPLYISLRQPEASIEPSGHKLADEEGYQQASELWLKQVERNKSNEKVLLNATTFGQRPKSSN